MAYGGVHLRTYLQQFVPLMPSGNQYVDVRDTAQVHLRLLERPGRAGRYILGGNYVAWRDLDFRFRPVEDSFRDAIGRLYAAGHVSAKQAGFAARQGMD
jgi:nucleoside-diphosphate-sugar epimerase